MKTTVILGAGFSKNSGIPVQAEIPEKLITYGKDNKFENEVSRVLKKFMSDVFGYSGGKSYPNLEDMFTCIDISTNSGHHLGIRYSPAILRAIRRFLVYRVFSILHYSFSPMSEVGDLINALNRHEFDTKYVVLNWDNVLERYLLTRKNEISIDYCNGGIAWDEVETAQKKVKVLKLHGSSNWLYCDNCRDLFYDIKDSTGLLERAGFLKDDLELLNLDDRSDVSNVILEGIACKACGNKISSHIATFSYRKTFRANSFSNIWKEAEKVLVDAERWIFIGYSLPDADYEFKHLIKIAELKLEHMKKDKFEIDVVLLDSDKTIGKYEGFFGRKLSHIYNGGIKEYLEFIRTIY